MNYFKNKIKEHGYWPQPYQTRQSEFKKRMKKFSSQVEELINVDPVECVNLKIPICSELVLCIGSTPSETMPKVHLSARTFAWEGESVRLWYIEWDRTPKLEYRENQVFGWSEKYYSIFLEVISKCLETGDCLGKFETDY